MSNSRYDYGDYLRIDDSSSPWHGRVGRVTSVAKGSVEYYTIALPTSREVRVEGSLLKGSTRSAFEASRVPAPDPSKDQFPATNKTVMMTAPAVLEWLEGEIEDVQVWETLTDDPEQLYVLSGVILYLEGMATRFAETIMRGMDGDETVARAAPKK